MFFNKNPTLLYNGVPCISRLGLHWYHIWIILWLLIAWLHSYKSNGYHIPTQGRLV